MLRISVISVLAYVLAVLPAQAQPPKGYQDWQNQPGGAQSSSGGSPAPARKIKSGTGFFISNVGHVITNEHVVHGCDQVMIRGSVNKMKARVIGTDSEADLALILADVRPRRVASLRENKGGMQVNDPVMVIGYPLDHGATGVYKVERSIILGLEGPQDEPYWIQFADAALQGNSGGPLLDSSGNVVGVIVGKTKLVRKGANGQDEVVKQSDVAISLPVLKDFLHKHQVYFQYARSSSYYSIDRVENIARDYIVNIHCDDQEQR